MAKGLSTKIPLQHRLLKWRRRWRRPTHPPLPLWQLTTGSLGASQQVGRRILGLFEGFNFRHRLRALARKAVAQPKSLVIWADKGEYATRFCPEIADIRQKAMDILSEEWKKTVSANKVTRGGG
jgi:hypothetical protein